MKTAGGVGVILAQGEIFGPQTASSLSFSSDLVRRVQARASIEPRDVRTRMVICVSSAFCSTDQEKERLLVVYLVPGP